MILYLENDHGEKSSFTIDVEKAKRILLNPESRANYDKGSKQIIIGEYFQHKEFFKSQPF